jgi:hypothetical protein
MAKQPEEDAIKFTEHKPLFGDQHQRKAAPPDPSDDEHVYNFSDIKTFGEQYQRKSERPGSEVPPSGDKREDELLRNIGFADIVLKNINIDFSSASPATLNEARSYLQTSNIKNNLAVINVSFDGPPPNDFDTQLKLGELRSKFDEIFNIAKKLFNSSETYKKWKAEIKDFETNLRAEKYNDGKTYNEFNCPLHKFPEYDKNGKPTATVPCAIAATRHIYELDKVVLKYDQWRRQRVRFNLQSSKPIIEDYKDENVFTRELQNKISERYRLSLSEQQMKEATSRLAVKNQFHSMKDKLRQLRDSWDKKPRIEMFVKDIYKMEGTKLQLAVMEKWLMAAVLRVFIPGIKFDLIPYWWSKEGATKTYSFAVLFGSDNVLEENIFTYTSKEQSEMTRHGIICVEIADPDDERTTGGKRFKSDVTRRSWRGRDAFARLDEMQTVRITYVNIITGNNLKILHNKFGNRRVIPMQICGEIDISKLWREKDQILGEAVVTAEKAWRECLEQYRHEGINVDEIMPWDIKCDALMLDDLELRSAAALIQKDAMVDDVWEESLSNIICRDFIVWNDKLQCVLVDSELIRSHFNVTHGAWISVSKRISSAMQTMVVLGKDEYKEFMMDKIRGLETVVETHPEFENELCDLRQFYEAHPELSQDLRWVKPKSIKISGDKHNGYRINCTGSEGKDYEILKKVVEMWKKAISM